jgi:hypothetical protein
MVAIYFVGVFLIGAILGGVLGIMLYTAAGSSPEPAVLVILAVIGGIIALVLQKFMIIVSTAFGGAWGVVAGIAYFTTGVIDPTGFDRLARSGGAHLFVIVLCWLVLGIVGVIVQYRSTPAKQKQVQPSASPNT